MIHSHGSIKTSGAEVSGISQSVKASQMVEYGDTVSDPGKTCMLPSNNIGCYEEDHLISLENGGNLRDPRNLWPEPYLTRIDGACVVDAQAWPGHPHGRLVCLLHEGKERERLPVDCCYKGRTLDGSISKSHGTTWKSVTKQRSSSGRHGTVCD